MGTNGQPMGNHQIGMLRALRHKMRSQFINSQAGMSNSFQCVELIKGVEKGVDGEHDVLVIYDSMKHIWHKTSSNMKQSFGKKLLRTLNTFGTKILGK